MSCLPTLLWVDFLAEPGASTLSTSLPKTFAVERVSWPEDICGVVEAISPWAICFEYDQPCPRGLDVLRRTFSRFQALPVLMLGRRGCKALTGWARSSVIWDYLEKPCTAEAVSSCLLGLRTVPRSNDVPASTTSGAKDAALVRLGVSFLLAHYPEKIPLAKISHLCGLSPFQFSRTFKKVEGITFRDYLVQLRIRRAAALMKQGKSSVTDAAFVVGFNDLSYFARVFRKQVGVSPSQYRASKAPLQMSLFPACPAAPLQKSSTLRARKS